MTAIDARDIAADRISTDRLAAEGLTYRVVDTGDAGAVQSFQRTMARGFMGGEPTAEALSFGRPQLESRRNIGVYDGADGAQPVASIDSWVTPVALAGGNELPMWAISGVTVASTHRRRGIARALLEGELRAAAGAGLALAGLTVTEATIYGRYGFGHAVPMSRFTVDTRRAGWGGRVAGGRLEYVDRETLAAELGAVHDRVRRARPGQIPGWPTRWAGMAGLSPSDTRRDDVRGVRYLDRDGVVRGAMAFVLTERGGTFRFALDVRLLVAETDEATAELWRFAVQHDLVDEVTASLRPTDDPLPWLVRDARGVSQSVHDHGWLRILDVPAALSARGWSAPVDVALRVEDPLGFAAGSWRLHVDASGETTVEAIASSDAQVVLDVAALSSLYAGAVRVSTLRAAGRVTGDPSALLALERAGAAFPAPALDIWY